MIMIFVLIEFYTLFNWKKFVKKQSLDIRWFKIPKYISIVLLAASTVSMFSSLFVSVDEKIRYITMFLIALWILPKLLIVVILLLKDFGRLFLHLARKVSNKKIEIVDENKRKIIQTSAWSLATIPFIMVSKGLLSTTLDFTIRRTEIKIPNLPKGLDGLRIVQISDLHLGSFFDYSAFQEVSRLVNGLKPDIIVITGDFVNNNPKEIIPNYNDLKNLKADIGLYSCLGNHDHYMKDAEHQTLIKVLNDLGANLMINRSEKLIINGSILNIVGIDNIGMRQNFGDLDEAFKNVNENETSILLCHDPTNWDKNIRNKYPADLTLSGHTHGGQVAWEFNGLELKPAKFVYRQSEGLYRNAESQIYVNRGIGTVGPPLRIGVKPEITEIILKA